MKSRRIYFTSVFALFAITVGIFLLDHVSFAERNYGFQSVFAFLFLGSLIGIILCSVDALDHTASLRISTKAIVLVACLATLLFLFTIIRGTLQ
jgi:hypothetical protein